MFETLTGRFSAWRQEHLAIRRLAQMDDRLLIDIGACRNDIRAFVRSRGGCR